MSDTYMSMQGIRPRARAAWGIVIVKFVCLVVFPLVLVLFITYINILGYPIGYRVQPAQHPQ